MRVKQVLKYFKISKVETENKEIPWKMKCL